MGNSVRATSGEGGGGEGGKQISNLEVSRFHFCKSKCMAEFCKFFASSVRFENVKTIYFQKYVLKPCLCWKNAITVLVKKSTALANLNDILRKNFAQENLCLLPSLVISAMQLRRKRYEHWRERETQWRGCFQKWVQKWDLGSFFAALTYHNLRVCEFLAAETSQNWHNKFDIQHSFQLWDKWLCPRQATRKY